MSVCRTYILQHLFWQRYEPDFQVLQIALKLFLIFFFSYLTEADVNPQISDIYSDKKFYAHFRVLEPTSRISILIYFELCKGPVGINMVMTPNSDLCLIQMVSKQYKMGLWYPYGLLPNSNCVLKRVAFTSAKMKATCYILSIPQYWHDVFFLGVPFVFANFDGLLPAEKCSIHSMHWKVKREMYCIWCLGLLFMAFTLLNTNASTGNVV